MKKVISILILAVMVAALAAGCGPKTEPVSGISAEQQALLQEYGIPMDQFNQMSEEEQRAILDELGIVASDKEQENNQTQQPSKTYTPEDVAAGGKYKVRIGDGRLNNYYLYYEDGKLVKVEISFQKNDDEEAETYLFEGDTLEDFWYYGKTLQELIDYFNDQGYGYETFISPMG